MSTIIEINHLSKRYTIGKNNKPYIALREEITSFFKNPIKPIQKNTRSFSALTDITFSLEQGETLGIIGSNGAGKSTLLKILSRVSSPTSGEVILKGKVASLLEVGTGFHPELTGRENIYLNGSIMGLDRKEIIEKFSSIVAFSGIENFLDTPIKYYSTGMYTRLAFSIAAHLDPEVLIVDEVLSVGDLSFQKKSMAKMHEVSAGGRTVFFVSHQLPAISKLCKRVLLIDEG